MNTQTPDMDEHQSLVDHLTALRDSLLRSLVFVFIGFLVSWGFSEIIFDFVRAPIEPFLKSSAGGLIFTAPMDKFLAHIKVSFLAGIIVSCPFWLHQLWRFIAPGLYPSERKFGLVFISVGSVLFLTGVTFVYTVVYPMAFKFLMGFGGGVDKPMITISEYLSFFVTTTLVFGAAFEMPLILTMLGVLGVIDYKFLKEKRRYAIVLLAALSAIVTPPDVISMLMMMGPMVLLYESSIWAVYLLGRKNK